MATLQAIPLVQLREPGGGLVAHKVGEQLCLRTATQAARVSAMLNKLAGSVNCTCGSQKDL